MNRRLFLLCASAAGAPGLYLTARAETAKGADMRVVERMQAEWRKLLPEGYEPVDTAPLKRSHEDWQAQLGDPAYRILFEEDTERPFTSPLNQEKRPGLFVCAACDLPLFTSEMKYDSGTGWPSFFTHIPEHLETKSDFKLIWPRTEYHCVKCGGHHGHVFSDGPRPTGERWCNNGLALRFTAQDG